MAAPGAFARTLAATRAFARTLAAPGAFARTLAAPGALARTLAATRRHARRSGYGPGVRGHRQERSPEPIQQIGPDTGQTAFRAADIDQLVPGREAAINVDTLGYRADNRSGTASI
jgi:hypothetical protein